MDEAHQVSSRPATLCCAREGLTAEKAVHGERQKAGQRGKGGRVRTSPPKPEFFSTTT